MLEMLLVLVLAFGALVLVPILLLKLLFHLALALFLLPFRILGALMHVLGGILGAVLKVAFSGLALVGAALGLVVVLVLLPLFPFLLLAGAVWAIARAFGATNPARRWA